MLCIVGHQVTWHWAVCRLVGTNLIIPHIVGNAGVLRNFSAYLAQLLNVNGSTNLQARLICGDSFCNSPPMP
jgi:hypothetical protein